MKRPSKQVQIVPLGYERKRVSYPIEKWKPNIVVLIRQEPTKDYPAEFQDEIEDKLAEDASINLKVVYCDLFDLFSSMEKIAEQIYEHSQDEVWVNLATGSKITAIAGMIACMILDANPFYPHPRYGNNQPVPPEKPKVQNVSKLSTIPVYPIKKPTNDQLHILNALKRSENGLSKGDLIEVSEKFDLRYMNEYSASSKNAKYRLIETHILEPLKDENYVQEQKVGQKRIMKLTQQGQDIIGAFSFLMPDDLLCREM